MDDIEEQIRLRAERVYGPIQELNGSMLSPEERDPAAERGFRVILEQIKPTIVFDVGAHVGDGAQKLRKAGYTGRLVSFEPQREIFELLARRAQRDDLWTAKNLALSSAAGTQKMNVMRLDVASSLRPPSRQMTALIPEAGLVSRSETVQVETLDSVAPDFIDDNDRIFLQIDIHGSEWNMLQGAEQTLKRTLGMKIEMALVPMYENEVLMPDIAMFLYERGFRLVGLNPVCVNEQGHLLWVHGYFLHTSIS